jgi:hypothetical protein
MFGASWRDSQGTGNPIAHTHSLTQHPSWLFLCIFAQEMLGWCVCDMMKSYGFLFRAQASLFFRLFLKIRRHTCFCNSSSLHKCSTFPIMPLFWATPTGMHPETCAKETRMAGKMLVVDFSSWCCWIPADSYIQLSTHHHIYTRQQVVLDDA